MTNTNEGGKHTVLAIDDDPATLRILAKLLVTEYEVSVATNGNDGLKMSLMSPMPDVILLDVQMPGLDGYAVCNQLKNNPVTRHIPVIFVTSQAAPAAEEYGLSLGAVDYVAKPFTPGVLQARVRTQLKLRGLISELESVNLLLSEKLKLLQKQHDMLASYSNELGELKSRQRLFAQVFENTSDGVVITSKAGEIIAVNESFTKICGYTEAEVLGRNPRLLKSGRHDDVYFETMWERIAHLGSWTGEIWNRRKNGEVFAELLSISTVFDESGAISCYVGVFNDVSHFKVVQERIEFLTWHDAVTGLPNRQLFSDRLVHTLTANAPTNLKGAVLVFDIENFSDVNASRGMQLGDQILFNIAQRLNGELEYGQTLARLGGAHFAVLIPRTHADASTAALHAGMVANHIKRLLHDFSMELESDLFHLRGTLGVAVFPENQEEVSGEIVRRAESARREASAAGGNTVTFFEAGMSESIEEKLQEEQSLRKAIAHNELCVFLQSKVNLHGDIHGAEALVRWNHPEKGLLAPGLFIPQAETSHLIVALDRWMLESVCRLLAFLSTSKVDIPIAVNISSRHFQEPDFVNFIADLMEQYQVPTNNLILEITEGMMLGDVPQVIERMQRLTALGIRFSIDDFGTGYSSLAYLKQLPVQELKIDKSFTDGLPGNDGDVALIEVILDIAFRFGLHVVAEGVETESQAEFLRNKGVPSMQGYYFCHPKGVGEWLKRIGLASNDWD